MKISLEHAANRISIAKIQIKFDINPDFLLFLQKSIKILGMFRIKSSSLQQFIKLRQSFLNGHGRPRTAFLSLEKLTMTAQSNQLDDVSILVIPYQQEVTIDMTLQAALVLPT